MKDLLRRLCLIEAVLTVSSYAAPSVTSATKAEPPNWWVHHTRSAIQALLTGAGLNDAAVTAPKGFQIDVRRISDNGHYLFAYLTIGRNTKAAYRFEVKSAIGSATFEFAVDEFDVGTPLDSKGRFQGFSPEDVIYPIMPDRFAAGRTVAGATHGEDVRGIRSHLAYLKELGVTMTPVHRNSLPGVSSYHGYSSVDFYAVEPRFGTMQEIGDLLDCAHAMGLKVVQDQVPNHNGPRHPFVADLGATLHRRVAAGYTPQREEEPLSLQDRDAVRFRNIWIRGLLGITTKRRTR
jgi:hypothetical protein